MSRNYRHRRHGVYIGPLGVALVCLLAGVCISYLLQMQKAEPAEQDSPASPVTFPIQSQQNQRPIKEKVQRYRETASGIACTLTALGENRIYTGDLILVNNKILYHFPEEQELESIFDGKTSSYYVKDREVYLAPVALDALNDWMDAFREQGGSKTINIIAGYRTEELQQHLFEQSAERNGRAHAENYVAQPGGSEHHTGLVVDLSVLRNGSSEDYDGTGEYVWLNENCHNYGYIVRYETGKEELTGIWDEPWHFRYIGVPHATAAASLGMCLEEYIDYLKQFPFDGEHLQIDCVDGTYEVWYTAGTEVYLPDSGEYSVSGNNVDGIIVTYKVDS